MSEQAFHSSESASSPQRRVNPESIEGLFLEALEITSAAERVAFLDRVSEGDAVRRRRLEALLRAYDDSGSFLEHSPIAAAEENFDFLTPSDKPGTLGLLGHYEVIDVIGRGGMGVVFRALDPRLNRVVAIKVLAPELAASPLARRRFLREAQAAAAVSHPHVVTIHAVDEQKLPYLVMECIVGQSLQQKIDNAGPLRLTEILRIGHQIAEGLAAAHRQGLIHRDIKPANVLLENGVERVKITDFGLARAADDAAITRTGEVSGTPQYMSPEQAKGERVDARSDLFSLGCVMYAMCTGRSPFRADSMAAAIRRVCDDAPRPIGEMNPEVPAWLIEIIGILLEKNPANRFQTAEEVGTALAACLERMQRQGAIRSTQIPLPQRPATASEETIPQPLAEKDFTDHSTTAYDDFFDRGKTPVAGLATFLGGLVTALVMGFCGGMAQASSLSGMSDFSTTAGVISFIIFLFFVSAAVGVTLRTDLMRRGEGALPVSSWLILASAAAWGGAIWAGFLGAIRFFESYGHSVGGAGGFPSDAALLLAAGLVVALTLGASWFWVRAGLVENPEPLVVDARRSGRFLVGFAFFTLSALVTWWGSVAAGKVSPVPLGPLSETMPVVGFAILAIAATQLTIGLVLQRRLFGLKTYAQLASNALLAAFAGAMVLIGLTALLMLVRFISSQSSNGNWEETPFAVRIGSLGPLESCLVLLVVLVVVLSIAAIWKSQNPSRGSERLPASRNTQWLKLTVVIAMVLFLIPAALLVMDRIWHANRLAGARRREFEQKALENRLHEVAIQNSAVPQVVHIVPDEESNWGAVLIDFGDGVSAGMPAGMAGMSPYSGRQVAIRLKPAGVPASADSSEGSGFPGGMMSGDMMGAGMSASDDVVFRRDGESFRRSHAIRESGLYRLAPGNYDIWLYDWEFGWVNPADTNEMAPQTPVAPQRGGSKRFWGTIEIKTGEIGTIQVRESDPAVLYKTVAETRPKLEASDRLRTFLWNTASYTLTERQAAIVQRLLVAAAEGQPFVEESDLLRPENPGDEAPLSSESVPREQTPENLPAIFNDGRHPAMAILQRANPDEHEGRHLWRLAEPRGLPKRMTFTTTQPPGSPMVPIDPFAPMMPGMPPGATKQKPGTNIEHLVTPLDGGKKAGTKDMPTPPEGALFLSVPVEADPPLKSDGKNPAASSDAPVDALKAENSTSP